MSKRKAIRRGKVVHLVTLALVWPDDKWDVLNALAEKNHVSLPDMVDLILDDWAALANHEIGNVGVPRVLESEILPTEPLQ